MPCGLCNGLSTVKGTWKRKPPLDSTNVGNAKPSPFQGSWCLRRSHGSFKGPQVLNSFAPASKEPWGLAVVATGGRHSRHDLQQDHRDARFLKGAFLLWVCLLREGPQNGCFRFSVPLKPGKMRYQLHKRHTQMRTPVQAGHSFVSRESVGSKEIAACPVVHS